MSEENRKYYRKLSIESMLFSGIGLVLLLLLCGVPGGNIRYLAPKIYDYILAIASIAFLVGLGGLYVTRKKDCE